jgi:hypothetical protein
VWQKAEIKLYLKAQRRRLLSKFLLKLLRLRSNLQLLKAQPRQRPKPQMTISLTISKIQ